MIVGLLSPLIVFALEVINNPMDAISISVGNVEISGDKVVVTLILDYRGSVPLADFKMSIGNQTVDFGDVTKGRHEGKLEIPASEAVDTLLKANVKVSFRVAGIYFVRITFG